MSVVTVGIASIAIVVAICVLLLIRVGQPAYVFPTFVVIAGLMAVQLVLASGGLLRQWDRVPPPFLPMMLATIAVTLTAALSSFGRRLAEALPFGALIGFQAFRLPLELVMHRAATIGLMPVQMSYSGQNFDLVTGVLAIPVAVLAASNRAPLALIWLWNLLGLGLLLNVVIVAVASLPVFAAFGPDHLNTWVADPPFVWLPGVLVPAALFGHVLTFRRLRSHATA